MIAASRFLAVLLFSAGAMFAQEQNALRSTAPERAVQMRVQVLYPGGTPVYDSDWKSGNIIDVSELPYGSYQLRISSRDLEGRVSERLTAQVRRALCSVRRWSPLAYGSYKLVIASKDLEGRLYEKQTPCRWLLRPSDTRCQRESPISAPIEEHRREELVHHRLDFPILVPRHQFRIELRPSSAIGPY